MRTAGWMALAGAALGVSACDAARAATPLSVAAAASTADVVSRTVEGRGQRVRVSLGASGTLARQIADGAPADAFVTAHVDWLGFLEERGLVAGEAIELWTNELVLAVPSDSAFAPGDTSELLASLSETDRLAFGDEGVPVGEYARAALVEHGSWDAQTSKAVGLPDARAVVRAVESGEVAAGFVYASDAETADVRVLFSLDARVRYYGVVLAGSERAQEARDFLEELSRAELFPAPRNSR